ncbi:MAG: pseudouridine synthase [Caldicoprobacterales bacterium]|jgi:23S rRNA pseudouridine2605 synthase|nr:rRNA pseudouridine synthase [Clostridiales bacterium]
MRLHKYMAYCGIGSRRKCEELIRQGRVFLNGKQVTKMGTIINPDKDVVTLDQNQHLELVEEKIYIMLNKPQGIITSVYDPQGRKTVLEHMGWKGSRIFPVGRLDFDTEGLLILTNDGEFAFTMTHPKHQVEKGYYCVVKGLPKPQAINRLKHGVDIGGFVTSPAEVEYTGKSNGNAIFRLTIHEGKNRQVRRMFEAIGHPVIYLRRERIGNLTLGELNTGLWRYLSHKEVIDFKLLTGGKSND